MIPGEPALWVRLCGYLAPFASILGCCSPLPTIWRIQRERGVGNLPLLPYTIMIINSLLWFSYGVLLREIRIWGSNGIGLVLGVYYFTAYLPFVPPSPSSSEQFPSITTHNKGGSSTLPGTLQQHFQAIALALLFVVFTMLTAGQSAAYVIGRVGVVVCVSLFASPLAAIRVVLETRSSRSIPLPFTVAMTINCFLWTVFGLWQADDANIYVPNGLGLGFQLAQVGLKLYFEEDRGGGRKSSEHGFDVFEDNDNHDSTEMTLPLAKAPASVDSPDPQRIKVASHYPKKQVVVEHV